MHADDTGKAVRQSIVFRLLLTWRDGNLEITHTPSLLFLPTDQPESSRTGT